MRILAVCTTLVALTAGCSGSSTSAPPTSVRAPLSSANAPTSPAASTPNPALGPTTPLLAVGDIADCKSGHDEDVARVLAQTTGDIALIGDIAYEKGTATEFARCYDPAFGALRSRVRPVPGNHEYASKNAAPYFQYFGAAAGDPKQGFYSYEVGSWHVVALNSNCDSIGGCGDQSPQTEWLRADLAAARARGTACSIAYFHHPRFSSGLHGNTDVMDTTWRVLADAGTEVVLSGHDHHYERFAPMNADGKRDANGTRNFVVGTGGRKLYPVLLPAATSEVHDDATFGALRLNLGERFYSWEYLPTAGAFRDAGSGRCQ